MDKLKENKFWIAVGGVGAILLVLVYFLVLAPLGELGEAMAAADKEVSRLKASARKPMTKELRDWLQQKQDQDSEAAEKGVSFYAEQGKAFDLYFDDVDQPPELATFTSRYEEGIKNLVEGYRTKFGIPAPPPEELEGAVPVVKKFEGITDEKIPQAMKEFWVLDEVFKAATELELMGLRLIDFPGRGVDRDPPPYNKWVSATVTIEIPFSKIENFMSRLFASKRVPFQLDELTMRKDPAVMAQFQTLVREAKFKDVGEAAKAPPPEEPAVLVDLKLSAFDWTGVPAEVEAQPEETDDADKKKSGPGKRPGRKK